MKKSYMTPMVIVEELSSATTFSSKCVFKSNLAERICAVDKGPSDFFEGHDFLFDVGADGSTCNMEYEGGSLCYHAPTAKEAIFTS